MKKSLMLFVIMLLCIICFCALSTGCGGDEQSGTLSPNEQGQTSEQDAPLVALKAEAATELDNSATSLLNKIIDDTLRDTVTTFFQQKKNVVSSIAVLDDASVIIEQIKADTATFIANIIAQQLTNLKTAAVAELDNIVNVCLDKLQNEELKMELQTFYANKKTTISAVDSLEDASAIMEQVKTDVQNLASTLLAQQLSALKTAAIGQLDDAINGLLDKISDDELKVSINNFYQQEKDRITAISSIDGVSAALENIKSDTTEFVNNTISAQLAKLKNAALAQLDEVVATGLDKLNDNELKTELNTFYTTEKTKINTVSDINQIASVSAEVISDTTDLIKKLAARAISDLRATVKGYFNQINQAFTSSPYDYLPDAMKAGCAANLVSAEQVEYDFSTFVSVDNIKYGGFGKQWNMVVDNISQSELFYKYLNTGNTVIASAITAIADYLDSEYADTIEKSFENDHFAAAISFVDSKFTYTLEYKTGISLPLFGSVSPQITMLFDTATSEKTYTITLTDTNRMRYIVSDDKYEFGIEYGVSAGQRTSYLVIERTNGGVEGHIYEYITLKGKDVMPSCADFYIENGYVSVVGNKADAMTGTQGYINELYKADEGKLLGYEVRETISAVNYNTLWFNLSDISGITSIKIGDKTDDNESSKSTNDVYLNSSDTLFAPTYNKKALIKTSRKYDIEFRTQYFYSIDEVTGETIEIEVEVPMLFIQEGANFNSYTNDMLADNGITSTVIIDANVLNKIMEDYDLLIDEFINNKQMMSSVEIKAYIEN